MRLPQNPVGVHDFYPVKMPCLLGPHQKPAIFERPRPRRQHLGLDPCAATGGEWQIRALIGKIYGGLPSGYD